MILDLNDSNWDRYFTREELDEIDSVTKQIKSQEFPNDMKKVLKDDIPKTTDIKAIFQYLNTRPVYEPLDNHHLYWLKRSMQEAAYLFLTGYFPITDELERDIIRRVWSFVGESFDSSELKFRRYFDLDLKYNKHCAHIFLANDRAILLVLKRIKKERYHLVIKWSVKLTPIFQTC